jgi:hypothetical protein
MQLASPFAGNLEKIEGFARLLWPAIGERPRAAFDTLDAVALDRRSGHDGSEARRLYWQILGPGAVVGENAIGHGVLWPSRFQDGFPHVRQWRERAGWRIERAHEGALAFEDLGVDLMDPVGGVRPQRWGDNIGRVAAQHDAAGLAELGAWGDV